jgi:sacsin
MIVLFFCNVFCRLYDPRIPQLRKVLHREAFFPSNEFSDPETLETLVKLGLKKNLGFTGFLDCARSVSMLHESRDSETVSYGRKLVALLDALAYKLSAEEGECNRNELQKTVLCQNSSDGTVILHILTLLREIRISL